MVIDFPLFLPNNDWIFGNELSVNRKKFLSLVFGHNISPSHHHLVKWMSDFPVLSVDFEHNTVESLLEQVLTSTDIKIIEAIAQIHLKSNTSPTASDILKELEKSNSLKKTQLYERLNRLTRLGFVSVRILPRPRKYITNKSTISEGVRRWIDEQMTSIEDLSAELESFRKLINKTELETIVSAIAGRLSLGNASYSG